ncbi:unnamed protein product [Agarophyton chilense]
MHPTLALHLHPMCQEAIRNLKQCHSQRRFAKFLGACNDAKAALDKCLSQEYLVKRELNAAKAKMEKDRLRRILEEEKQFN